MNGIRVKEEIDRRYLGAVLFVDHATKGVVRRSFDIEAKGLHFFTNPSALHVISSAAGLESHIHSFTAPPDQPGIGSTFFDLTVSDPLQKYLPRIKRIALPRNPDPQADDSLFAVVEVAMFPGAAASVRPNWSIVRAAVSLADPERPLPGSLLRLVREEDGKLIASGLTDRRGEALIIAAGLPVHNFVTGAELPDNELDHDDWVAAGAVVEKDTAVRLEVVVDHALPWPVDPEVLEENRGQWRRQVRERKGSEWAD